MRHRILSLIPLLAVCLGSQAAQAQRVAVVLSQPVDVSEIEPRPDEVARQKAGLDSEAFARWLLQARAKRLAAHVQTRLLDAYAKRFRLEPKEAELRPLLRSLQEIPRQVEEDMKQVRQRRLTEIRKKLEAPDLDPAERARLNAERADWERVPPDRAAEILEGNRKMMSTLVQNWKVQRSLYRQYGGRVLVSSFGFHVAIDAQQRFLRDEETRGSFEIFDPDLRAAFWTAAADTTWADGVATARSADEVFATPPWEVRNRRP
jgi:hypothetical protein